MIGFRTPDPPLSPPKVQILWVVRKGDREARAIVRAHPHGRELVVMVGDNIAWSRLYRDYEDSRLLGQMSEGTRIDVERLGWVTDTASGNRASGDARPRLTCYSGAST